MIKKELESHKKEFAGTAMPAIANLFPGYFALIMATGIVSIAAKQLGPEPVAWVLLAINLAAFLILSCFLIIRIVRFFPRVKADITDHVRGPGFFTVPAATCVLGSQLIVVAGYVAPAAILWFVGLVLWALVMYSFFAAVTTVEKKPPLDKALSGAWLIAAVSTQSVSVLGTLLVPYFGAQYHEALLFFTTCMFLIGCMLYILLITLIFYRFTFADLTSERLTPPYWINMGAVAITTLAGARLILAAGDSRLVNEILPFLKGFTLFFWSAACWWIPLLFILGFWRHVFMRYPLRYDPQYWGLVFPLGMYTVCTVQLSRAIDFPQLMVIPHVFVYLAYAAWLVAFGAMLYSLIPRSKTITE